MFLLLIWHNSINLNVTTTDFYFIMLIFILMETVKEEMLLMLKQYLFENTRY